LCGKAAPLCTPSALLIGSASLHFLPCLRAVLPCLHRLAAGAAYKAQEGDWRPGPGQLRGSRLCRTTPATPPAHLALPHLRQQAVCREAARLARLRDKARQRALRFTRTALLLQGLRKSRGGGGGGGVEGRWTCAQPQSHKAAECYRSQVKSLLGVSCFRSTLPLSQPAAPLEPAGQPGPC
jgi:hypothetical protein